MIVLFLETRGIQITKCISIGCPCDSYVWYGIQLIIMCCDVAVYPSSGQSRGKSIQYNLQYGNCNTEKEISIFKVNQKYALLLSMTGNFPKGQWSQLSQCLNALISLGLLMFWFQI